METQTIATLEKNTLETAASCCTQPANESACCTPGASSKDENNGACCAQPADGSACCDK